jgi:hypothetical protein
MIFVLFLYVNCLFKSSRRIVSLSCFFQRPAQSFINAAKQCSVDNLCGSLDAVAWGKEPFNGTSGPFEIMHSGKVCIYDCIQNILP